MNSKLMKDDPAEVTDKKTALRENLLKHILDQLPNALQAALPALNAYPKDPGVLLLTVMAALIDRRPDQALRFLHRFTKNWQPLEYEDQLLHYGTSKLRQIPGLRIVGEAKEKVSVISFVVDKLHPQDLGILLDNYGIAVRTGHHCAQPLMDCYRIPGTVRASLAIYNTKEEIDELVVGLKKAIKMLS